MGSNCSPQRLSLSVVGRWQKASLLYPRSEKLELLVEYQMQESSGTVPMYHVEILPRCPSSHLTVFCAPDNK